MKYIGLIAVLSIGTAAFAQTGNRITFQPGQKLEIVTETKKTTNLELMGQQMSTVISTTVTESYDVEKAGADGATIEYKVKRMVANMDGGMMGSQSFDSEKEGDRKGQLGQLFEKGLKNKYSFTIDPYGTVTAVKKDDDNPNGAAKPEEEAMAGMMSAQFGFSFGSPKAGDASVFKLLPSKEIAKTDSWTEESSADGQKKKTVYTVANIDDNAILLDYTETLEIDATQEIMGTQAKMKSTDSSKGQITIDRKTGLLKQKTFTSDSKGTIEAQGMSIPTTGTTTITVKVNAL